MVREARRIAVAGAGIAGLSTALALARRGFEVDLFERAEKLEEVGAGLQLSPNATRILSTLGVLQPLEALAVEPEEIVLRRAASLRRIGAVPLGTYARERWGAPYLTIHRADLQSTLAQAVRDNAATTMHMGATAMRAQTADGKPSLTVQRGSATETVACDLVVAADGVWSTLRSQIPNALPGRYSGYLAWRAVIEADDKLPADRVTTFVHPRFHIVAYPLRAGRSVNIVVLAKGPGMAQGWSNVGDLQALEETVKGAAPELLALIRSAGSWTTWPLHEIPAGSGWTDVGGIAAVGDAAHAMTPFAAQGAAMAIEDAAALADCVAECRHGMAAALQRYEALRRPRVEKTARRGAFNRFVWHAAGPVALGRDLVLALRPARSLAADMDWLYGYEVRGLGK